jgi:N-acetylglucosaminyl-diphospho-decaprenol L-rhamnosyltransferase
MRSKGKLLPELSIIFVNWNATNYLRACLKSIYSQRCGLDCEIVVVDNASPNRDVELLAQEFPNVHLINSRENIGFARANNLGFQHSSGKYLLFLNPDTEVIGPAIQRMIARLHTLTRAGALGCKLLNSDRSVQTSCIQRFPTILNQMLDIELLRLRWPACRLWRIDPLFSLHEDPCEVEAISGACLMMRREVFEAVGLFSEDYFMYAEDVDLCFKALQAGYINYFIGEASMIHHGGGSSKQKSDNQWAAIAQRQAIHQLCQKTRGPLYAWLFRAATAVSAIIRLLLLFPVSIVAKICVQKKHVSSSWKKWMAVLRWSIGLDATTLRFPNRQS